MVKEFEERVNEMCNLGEGIAEEAARKAARKATRNEATRNILKLLEKNKTIDEIVYLLEYSVESVTAVAKNNGYISICK